MTGKITYRVGSDGTANYSTLLNIPAEILAQGETTFMIFPGTYDAPTNAIYNDVAFVGQGDTKKIIINGAVTIANTSTGTTVFENLTLVGTNATAGSGSACVTKIGAASAPVQFKRVIFSNADFAVSHSAELSFATTTRQVTLDYCDASAVDRTVRANANVGINFSSLNISANAYFTPGGGAGVPAVTVRASTSAGGNTGNSTKTVLAAVS